MNWKLHELFADEKAVSPVVGVALLIAMTVILAAVIGAVVLGLGAGSADAPQASFSFEVVDNGNGDVVVATHEGGDSIALEEMNVTGSNVSYDDIEGGSWSAGETVTVNDPDDVVRIVWEDPNSDQTHVLARYNP